ncbi:MAG: ATP-binding protein [Ignavibacteria bacterium]|nr:ATP-binding protein [Ignavibacteria bacterium]
MGKSNKIILTSSTKNLAKVRDFVGEQAAESGFDDSTINQIILSVDEACTNIIKHAHKYDENETIEVETSFEKGEFKIILKYKGKAFDPNGINNPNMKEYFSSFKVGGLGVPIMKKFMTKIEFDTKNSDTNLLTLIKIIHGLLHISLMEYNDPVRKQLELNSLIEFSQLISSKLDLKYILNNILLSTMGKMLISKGMMLIRIDAKKEDGLFVIESLKGLDQHLAGTEVKAIFPKLAVFDSTELDNGYSYLTDLGLHHFFKVYFQNKLLGVLCLGKKLNNTSLSNSEVVSIETMLNISASAIENTIRFNEVKSLNADLNNRVRQLKSLFELSKEFNSSIIDKDSIIKVLSFTLLGNFGIKDFIIFSRGKDDKFSLIKDSRKISAEEISPNEVFPLQSTSDKMKKTIRISDFTESEFFPNFTKQVSSL